MESIWKKNVKLPERESLDGDKTVEVAVIGAGMAGLLTAYFLQKRGKEVIVLEAAGVGSGQTGNTTAKITIQHGAVYDTLIRCYGREKASLYARANEAALEAYAELIRKEKIDCHFERTDSYLYSTEDEKKITLEAEAAAALGIRAQLTGETGLPFPVKTALCFADQAQFHPLEFVKQIADRLTVYEHTEVLKVNGHQVKTGRGTVTAEHIVFATHYPFPNVPGFYFVRQHQQRSYVLALEGIPKWKGMYYSPDKSGLSFRWYEDLLLVGGGGHRTGEKEAECGYSALRRQAKALFPEGRETACWAAQDCMTHDELPLIGRFSVFRNYWYVATGFKKWGMTTAMIAARLIADQICGRDNLYAKLFTPQRAHLGAAGGKLWEDVKYSVSGLAKGHFGRNTVKCSHLGCALVWNAEEESWDCPCHGSRFDKAGKLADNPAQTDLRVGEDSGEI